MFFVTFHQSVSNVYAYDDDGNLLNPHSPNVLDKDGDELRGIYLGALSGYLYVVSGGLVSGMAFDAAGNFHVAARTKNLVMKYDAEFGGVVERASTPMPTTRSSCSTWRGDRPFPHRRQFRSADIPMKYFAPVLI